MPVEVVFGFAVAEHRSILPYPWLTLHYVVQLVATIMLYLFCLSRVAKKTRDSKPSPMIFVEAQPRHVTMMPMRPETSFLK